MTETYRVFKRKVWKANSTYPGGFEPYAGGNKRTVTTGVTIEEARRICEDGNTAWRGKTGRQYYTATRYEFEHEACE